MNPAWLQDYSTWLAETPVSLFLQYYLPIIPSLQSIHIVAVTFVVGAFLMVHLRVLGVLAPNVSLLSMTERFFPWVWVALGVLLTTGVILALAEPVREFTNPTFQLKMVLVLGAAIITAAFQAPLKRDASYWDATTARKRMAKIAAAASLVILVSIIMAGRWIAYTIPE